MSPTFALNAFSTLTKLVTSLNLLLTCPIYMSLLLFLHRQRHRAPFNSSFYRLFMALGIVDLSKYGLYLLKKCSFWGWIPGLFLPPDQPNRWAQLLYMALWALSFGQYQLNLLLSLNRFLSILWPQLYRHRWARQLFLSALWPVGIGSLLTVLPILGMPVLFRSIEIQLDGTNGGLASNATIFTGPVFMDKANLALYYGITKGFVLLLLIACLTGYPLCFAQVRRMNLVLDKGQAVEVKMFYALALLLVANLLYAAYFIAWELLSRVRPEWGPYAEWSLYLIIDFYDMNSPYGLLLTSRLVRQAIFPFRLFHRENAILPEKMMMSRGKASNAIVAGGWAGYYGTGTSSGSGGSGGGLVLDLMEERKGKNGTNWNGPKGNNGLKQKQLHRQCSR